MFTTFYDIFVRHAFGSYMNVLREISYSPLVRCRESNTACVRSIGGSHSQLRCQMAKWLTYLNNMGISASGTYPDENFAREIMQLFSVSQS